MTASAIDRRHAREVELAMEIVALADHQGEIDRIGDELRRQRSAFLGRLGRFIRSLIVAVPGGPRAWALFVGLSERLRQEDALDDIEDRDRERIRLLGRELAGLKDGTTEALA